MRKRLILVGMLLVVALGVLFAVNPMSKNDDLEEEPTQATVQLEGTSPNTQLDPTDDEAAQEAIGDMVRANEPDASQEFTAVVRKNSIVQSSTSYGAPKVRYLVDIPELQRTFIVEREGDATSDFASIYVRCPGESDLRYPAKECVELE